MTPADLKEIVDADRAYGPAVPGLAVYRHRRALLNLLRDMVSDDAVAYAYDNGTLRDLLGEPT